MAETAATTREPDHPSGPVGRPQEKRDDAVEPVRRARGRHRRRPRPARGGIEAAAILISFVGAVLVIEPEIGLPIMLIGLRLWPTSSTGPLAGTHARNAGGSARADDSSVSCPTEGTSPAPSWSSG